MPERKGEGVLHAKVDAGRIQTCAWKTDMYPKISLWMETQPVWMFESLGACANASHLQYISAGREAMVLWKQPACTDLVKPSWRCWEQCLSPSQWWGLWVLQPDPHLPCTDPSCFPTKALQHVLNPKTSTGDILSQFENISAAQTNKEMSQRAIETQPWEGLLQNKTCPQHRWPPQALVIWQLIKYIVFLIQRNKLGSKTCLDFPRASFNCQTFASLRNTWPHTRRKATIPWEQTGIEGWGSAGSDRTLSWRKNPALFLSQDIHDTMQGGQCSKQALKKEKKEEKEKEEGERKRKKGKSWDPALPALHGKDWTTFRRD